MEELVVLAIAFLILQILLLIINYITFSKYPHKKELALGGSILKRKGVTWFIITKFVIFTAFFVILMYISPLLLPTRYSYFILGFLLGLQCFNIIHDYLEYKHEMRTEI